MQTSSFPLVPWAEAGYILVVVPPGEGAERSNSYRFPHLQLASPELAPILLPLRFLQSSELLC